MNKKQIKMIWVSEFAKKQIKIYAAENNMTMQEFIDQLLCFYNFHDERIFGKLKDFYLEHENNELEQDGLKMDYTIEQLEQMLKNKKQELKINTLNEMKKKY